MASDHFMTPNEWKAFNHDKKLFNTLEKNRYYCKCGHSVIITPKYEKAFCDYCHRWIYKDEEKQKEYDLKVEQEIQRLKNYQFRKEMRKRLNDRTKRMGL